MRVDAGLIGPRQENMIADYIGLALTGQYKRKVGVEDLSVPFFLINF
jgi:hypothetical protein